MKRLKENDKIWHPEYDWCKIIKVQDKCSIYPEHYVVSTSVLEYLIKVDFKGYTILTDFHFEKIYRPPNRSWFSKKKKLIDFKN